MRLGLHLLPKTVDQYLHDLGVIAANSNTLVFLDTNILGYLYKLHAAARKEFFNWANELNLVEARLFIPAWSANEYLAKFKTGKFSEYAPSRPEQVLKSLNSLRETASLFVDDESLRKIDYKGDRSEFLDNFDIAINELSKFTSIFSQQFDTWNVHSEITSNLSGCILQSDLAELCSRAAAEGDVRNAHRLPPGYKDSSKTENKFGDLIIWYEILEHLKKNASTKTTPREEVSRHVLFVSNDEKSDWVYAPLKRHAWVKGNMREVSNVEPVIKIPDPRLVAEFRSSVGHDNVHIITLPMLIKALSTVRPKGLEYLASAIQIEVEGGALSEAPESETDAEVAPLISDELIVSSMAVESSAPKTNLAPKADQNNLVSIPINSLSSIEYPQDALRDGAYEVDAPGEINEIIRALRSQNWYLQNPAFQRIKEIRQAKFEPGQWFVLGRNIYQAACGNAQKALEFLKNIDIELSRFPQEAAIHLLSGMIFEVYFDRDGNFRGRPKAAHIEQIMREVARDSFAQSRNTLLTHLAPYDQWIPFKPGNTVPFSLDIEIAEKEVEKPEGTGKEIVIQSVKFLGEERLCKITGEDQLVNWFDIIGQSKATAKQIKSELSDSYAIPEWAIRVQLNVPDYAGNKLIIPNGSVLKLDRPPLPSRSE